MSRERFNNQGRNELQKLKENGIAKAGDYKAMRWGLTELNILKQTYIHNELVNSVQCFWKRLPFQQAKWVFKDGSSDGFSNRISGNHFISPNLFCEEEQLFISIKPWNRWLAGDGGGGGGLVGGCCGQWSPWKGGFPDNKTLIRAREGTLLSAAHPLSFGNSKRGREGRGLVTTALGRINQVRFEIYCLGNAGPPLCMFLEFVLLNTLLQVP